MGVLLIISQEQLQRVSNYCQSGIQSGAELVIGGQQYEDSKGNYFEPTIFDNVDVQTTIAQEEIFGPVTSIFDFENEDEAINIANSTDYGLASGVAMGLVFETLSMVLIMVPVLLPAAMGMEIDPIWFGIFMVVMVELSAYIVMVKLNV